MRIVKDLSIKTKLVGIILLVSLTGIVAGFSFIILNDIKMFKEDMAHNTVMNARLTGEYCVTPLIFEDRGGAEEILKKLKAAPHIVAGCVYDNRGVVFANYNKSDNIFIPPRPLQESSSEFTGEYLHVTQPIIYNNRKYGTIYLSASTSLLDNKINEYLFTMASLVAGLVFLSYLLASRLQKILSGPILKLADVTKKVSDDGEYSIHLEKIGNDEIGVLYDGFNGMLERIHTREKERNKAEKALRQSEQRFRSLVETTSDWVWETDRDGVYTYASPKIKDLLGYEPEDVIGKSPFDLMPADEAEKIAGLFKDIAEAREPFAGLENINIHKDGRHVVIETSGVPIFDAGGELLGYRGIDRDITGRKQAEEAREQLESQLKRAEKMEALGRLAGGVAHDLNNVLTAIIGYPDLLLTGLPADSPLRGPLLTIQKSGEKAAAIVQDLLTLARRGVIVKDVIKLNDMVSDYLRSPECEKLNMFHPGVQIVTDLEENLLNILGSPVHISTTLMNLVSNAAEALPDGGQVTISTRNQYIDRPIRGYEDVKEGDYVVLSVSDNGIGISTDHLERIFEPFYTKKVMGRSGTGLGLTVVWGTIGDHNGYIDVKSIEGKGTTFDLYFPATRKEAGKKKAIASIEEYMGNGETILVVDDVQEQREVASMILNKLGYSVHVVSSGEKAVEFMKTDSADLLILDMIMDPGMDGLDTYRKILELHPGTKAVIASGFSETDRVKEAQRLGAGQYVKKPYTVEKIGVAVKTELAR